MVKAVVENVVEGIIKPMKMKRMNSPRINPKLPITIVKVKDIFQMNVRSPRTRVEKGYLGKGSPRKIRERNYTPHGNIRGK